MEIVQGGGIEVGGGQATRNAMLGGRTGAGQDDLFVSTAVAVWM